MLATFLDAPLVPVVTAVVVTVGQKVWRATVTKAAVVKREVVLAVAIEKMLTKIGRMISPTAVVQAKMVKWPPILTVFMVVALMVTAIARVR